MTDQTTTMSSTSTMSQSAHDIVAAALGAGPAPSAVVTAGSTPGPNTSVDGHEESPEKLSLKARLKLFEKEIEQQGAAPAPKPGTTF